MIIKYKAVIFDLDGTLINSLDDIADSMNRVLDKHGLQTHTTANYLKMIGEGARNLVKCAVGEKSDNENLIDLIHAEYTIAYRNACLIKTYVYPGIIELINILKQYGVILNVLSNKPQDSTELTCNHYFGKECFDIIFGQRINVPRKPAPDAALEIAKLLNLKPIEILYIGDTATDMLTAKGAGMESIGVTWGFRSQEELEKNSAKHIVNQPFQILDILCDEK